MKYSHNNEQQYIEELIKELNLPDKNYVDIGASDGVEMSNTLFLAQKGWNGFCVEYNTSKFNALVNNYKSYPQIKCSNQKATPATILDIMKGNTPKTFTVLNLDIDGYDYFVLDKLLEEYKPAIICAEINEKIPPPIKFTVLYSDTYSWSDAPFFGQSIEQVQVLCKKYNYSIVNVEYNNVFLVNNMVPNKLKQLVPLDAWLSGYFYKPDRTTRFSHNNGWDPIYRMSAQEGIEFINKVYVNHKGRYQVSL